MKAEPIHLRLPWPPSTNKIWRNVVVARKQRTLLSASARQWFEIAAVEVMRQRAGAALLGTDVQARAAALEHAVQAHRLTADQAAVLLPAPAPSATTLLLQLEHAAAQSTTAPEVARQRLAAIRALVGGRAAA